MAIDVEFLEQRVSLLEDVVNKIQEALTRVATQEALSQLLLIKQQELADLRTDVEAIKNDILLLQEEVFK